MSSILSRFTLFVTAYSYVFGGLFGHKKIPFWQYFLRFAYKNSVSGRGVIVLSDIDILGLFCRNFLEIYGDFGIIVL